LFISFFKVWKTKIITEYSSKFHSFCEKYGGKKVIMDDNRDD